jgi:predicted ATPase/transcriptional regulator with XRE-family HTH domain
MPASYNDVANYASGEGDFPLYFGEWLKRRRKQLDLTQAELAELACCSVFALRKIEAGQRRPSKQLAGMLAKSLNIPSEDHTKFVKVARGELGVEKLPYPVGDSQLVGKPSVSPGNLPRALTPFIGREPELTSLAGLLQDPQCKLLTIVGPGGIGKTRLAIEAVQDSVDRFPDGIWFVALASLNSSELIIPAIADSMGFKFQEPTDLQDQLLRYLRAKRALLVLDNAEHLLDGAGLFTEILNVCQQLKLLVTSRERLNLMSEWVFEIQGLPVPANDQVKQFEAYSSVALFLQSARRVRSNFEMRLEERQWILKICQIMEGMPLGIELSAAWVGMLSIEEIASEIERNLDFLSVTMRDLPQRHRSLTATLDHSWNLLNPEEKLILSRLSVFHGRFSRKAAAAICSASIAVLSSLKNKSLLQRTDRDEYGLHEIIHQYALHKLAEDPAENERINEQHAIYFVQYLSDCEAALQSSRQVETLDEMARLLDNLAQGWLYLVTHCLPSARNRYQFPETLLHRSLFSISLVYEQRCRHLEAISLFERSVEYLKVVQSGFEGTEHWSPYKSVLGHIMAYLGLHHYYVLHYEQAVADLEEALRWLEDERSRVERAKAEVMLASVRDVHGQLRQSGELLAHSREIFREKGEDWWYTLSTINLAFSYLSIGKIRQSGALFQEALRLAKPGDLRLELPARNGYAVLLFSQNDFTKAEQILRDNLQLGYRLGNDRQIAFVLSYLGRVALNTNRIGLAEGYLKKSINILMELRESHDLALLYIHLGKCYAAKPDLNAACDQFRQVIRIGQEIDKFHLVYYGLVNLAQMYLIEGQSERALEIFILLGRTPVEYMRMQADFDHLKTSLEATLPGEQMEAALKQVDDKISIDQARADLLAYVHDHEVG